MSGGIILPIENAIRSRENTCVWFKEQGPHQKPTIEGPQRAKSDAFATMPISVTRQRDAQTRFPQGRQRPESVARFRQRTIIARRLELPLLCLELRVVSDDPNYGARSFRLGFGEDHSELMQETRRARVAFQLHSLQSLDQRFESIEFQWPRIGLQGDHFKSDPPEDLSAIQRLARTLGPTLGVARLSWLEA